MKKHIVSVVAVVALLAVSLFALGCASGHDSHSAFDTGMGGTSRSFEVEESWDSPELSLMAEYSWDDYLASPVQRTRSVERLITSGSLDIRSDDVRDTAQQLREKASSMDGTIQEEFTSTSDSPFGRLVVSVPTKHVDEYLAWVEETFDVEVFNVSRANVASTYIANIESIESLQARLELIRELYESEQHIDIETQLRLIDRIANLEGEIARFESHNTDIDEAVAYSDIAISINGVARIAWEANFWRNTLQTCATILENVVRTIIITATIILPFTPFVAVGVGIARYRKKRKLAEPS